MDLEIYSWNLNTNPRISLDLISKLLKNTKFPQIMAFSFQELVSQFSFWKGQDKSQDYISLIQQQLKFKYSLIHTCLMNGICLMIFKKNDFDIVLSIRQGIIGAGLGGVYGNKGAVAIGLEFENDSKYSSLCIVGAHLDPHQGQSWFIKRNSTANYIFSTCLLENNDSKRLMHDYDVIFFAGDLNYRFISKDLGKINELLDSMDIQGLVEKDELKLGKFGPWDSWKEGKITFLPTYKYKKDLSTKISDQFSKSRIPAYTDRILFKALKSNVLILQYDSIPGLGFSDHQPVFGRFSIDFDSSSYREESRLNSTELLYRMYWYKFLRIMEINWIVILFIAILYIVARIMW